MRLCAEAQGWDVHCTSLNVNDIKRPHQLKAYCTASIRRLGHAPEAQPPHTCGFKLLGLLSLQRQGRSTWLWQECGPGYRMDWDSHHIPFQMKKLLWVGGRLGWGKPGFHSSISSHACSARSMQLQHQTGAPQAGRILFSSNQNSVAAIAAIYETA